jgi:general secretion pathway protein K
MAVQDARVNHRPTGTARQPGVRSQRGVALVTALLVVSLATVAAVAMATHQLIDVRRSGNLLHGEQAYSYALAAESWARVILRRDLSESDYDSTAEDWATALPPIAVEGGVVSGKIEDLQGRFNVNNLLNASGTVNEAEMEYFKRLLDNLGLDQTLAEALADWIDKDIDVRFPNGAEDQYYLLQERPYRAANSPLVDISEMRLVKGFTPGVMQLLGPHVTALPEETSINVNTATAEVLRAMNAQLGESDIDRLIADRGDEGYKNPNDFLGHPSLAGLQLGVETDVTSSFFRVLTSVVIGDSRARIVSLLQRDAGETRIIYRVRSRYPQVLFEEPAEEQDA